MGAVAVQGEGRIEVLFLLLRDHLLPRPRQALGTEGVPEAEAVAAAAARGRGNSFVGYREILI